MEGKRSALLPANAPPAHEYREFSRAQGKNFEKVACLADRLNSKGFTPIVGSSQVKWLLEERGIHSVYNPLVANENEIILNRARASPDSNFFVFLAFDSIHAMSFFTDPERGARGRCLTKDELMRRSVSLAGDERPAEEWAASIADEALAVSEKKPRNTFYSIVHGHWGENKDMDDGVSSRKDVIRQMMLWHYDIDATGYHNWMDFRALCDITMRERDVGIVKVPSLELTMPFGLGSLNDPHFNIWFEGKETAADFYGKFLRHRKATKFPGMAPEVEKRAVLKYITEMRKRDEIAFGVAHPSCVVKAGVPLRMGILNLLTEKTSKGALYTWRAIKEFIRKYADGVAAYNPTLDDYKLRFREKAVQKYFEDEVWKGVSVGIGGMNGDETQGFDGYNDGIPGQMRENGVNMAMAKAMRKEYGKFIYFDHDTHNYAPFRFERAVSPLAYGRNTITFRDPAAFAELRKNGGLTSADFIRILRKREYKGHNVALGMDTFLELHKGRLRPVDARRSPFYGLLCLKNDVYHAYINVKYAVLEGWRRAKKSATDAFMGLWKRSRGASADPGNPNPL